ncbi:hypothetical protein PIB30_023283 [Stylosanthes scabra]|uniref:Glutamate receptor n=1 Tax=Stylosanthes scabra TaxID=79078 RepID=A0ABU6Z606_9FABA|nr:hypothetical protein [Stylosanthes scabra]
MQSKATIPVNVGVVLDSNTWIGKLSLSCIEMALSDLYASHPHYKTRLIINVKDSKSEVMDAALAAQDLIRSKEVKAMIGPQNSRQANLVIEVGHKSHVPIISFSATSPSLTSPQIHSPYFFRVAQNDASQVQAVSAIIQAFEWNQLVLIYSQGIYEEELIPFMARTLQEGNVQIPYQIAIPTLATDQIISQELYKLRLMSNRVFVVHVSPQLGSRIFFIARELGMMSQGYAWIITTKMSNQLQIWNSSVTDSMQGVLGVSSYFPRTKELDDFELRWKMKFQQANPSMIWAQMNVLGLWAYDATTALAMAIEKVEFESLGISQSHLRETLSKIKLNGLAGDFSFVNGDTNLSSYKIINLIGNSERVVGYWTPQNGLKRNMETTYSFTSKNNLGTIIWPGDCFSAPKGYDELANKKELTVGVPLLRNGFDELILVQHEDPTNNTNVRGYCIDVFLLAMRSLPYNVSIEFIPYYKRSDHYSPGIYYDDLLHETYLGKVDAVVGDITITAKRSSYVDFTLPFTESGAVFIVPTTIAKNKTKVWIFLRPLTWQLWLTTGCFFLFIAFVVWVLEHQGNREFNGSTSKQVSTSIWFSFSTLVFAQTNLTTQLTVQQLRPTVTNVYQLLQNGDSVGYHFGSYAYDFLRQLGFDDSKLKVYHNAQECDTLFTIGSQNGGISAAFDEITYIKIIMASYCSKYTIMGPTYRSEGFAFAFRRGSPLAAEVSRAILNLTELNRDMMIRIEEKWFKNESNCPQPSNYDDNSNNSLDLDGFRGLFMVAGLASSSALIIHAAVFLYCQKRRVFIQFIGSNVSLLLKNVRAIFKSFYQKDHESFPDSQNDREQISSNSNEITVA